MMQRILVGLTILFVGTVAAIYVVNTFLYLTPPNPIKLHLSPVVYALEHPFFAQNWHLFAPNPVKTNFILTVRCRLHDRVTSWHDPYTPLLAAHHRNRFTPMGKVLRIPQNAVVAFLGRNTDEWLPLLCRQKRHLAPCRGEDEVTKKQRDLGKFLLQRLSSTACDDLSGGGQTVAVQVRIHLHKPPPISQRHLPGEAGSTTYLTLPWAPYTPAPLHVR